MVIEVPFKECEFISKLEETNGFETPSLINVWMFEKDVTKTVI